MPNYTVRSVSRWAPRDGMKLAYLYEERVTAWTADSFEDAIALAEAELAEYASDLDGKALDLFQAFVLDGEFEPITQGAEVFSLLRQSDLDANEYIDTFFVTGHEHERSC